MIHTPNGAGVFAPQVMYGDLTHLTIPTEDSFRQLARLHGFGGVKLAEVVPVPRGIKGTARWFLWRMLRALFAFGKRIELGRRQELWSADFIARCYRGQ